MISIDEINILNCYSFILNLIHAYRILRVPEIQSPQSIRIFLSLMSLPFLFVLEPLELVYSRLLTFHLNACSLLFLFILVAIDYPLLHTHHALKQEVKQTAAWDYYRDCSKQEQNSGKEEVVRGVPISLRDFQIPQRKQVINLIKASSGCKFLVSLCRLIATLGVFLLCVSFWDDISGCQCLLLLDSWFRLLHYLRRVDLRSLVQWHLVSNVVLTGLQLTFCFSPKDVVEIVIGLASLGRESEERSQEEEGQDNFHF